MIIEIDANLPVAPYLQIRIQVTALVASGALPAGTRLPPVRQLAADLDFAPGTVARAYRELEQDGVVRTCGRRGTFVHDGLGQSQQKPPRELGEAARTFATQARHLGVDSQAAIVAVAAALLQPPGR